jgi:hypothetical protein
MSPSSQRRPSPDRCSWSSTSVSLGGVCRAYVHLSEQRVRSPAGLACSQRTHGHGKGWEGANSAKKFQRNVCAKKRITLRSRPPFLHIPGFENPTFLVKPRYLNVRPAPPE